MKLAVTHATQYHYSEPVTLGHNQVRLVPRSFERQKCLTSQLEIVPRPTVQRSWIDPFGNEALYFTLEEPHAQLSLRMYARVDMLPVPALPAAVLEQPWEAARAALDIDVSEAGREALLFRYDSPLARRLPDERDYGAASFPAGVPLFAGVLDLMRRIHADFRYDVEATSVTTTTTELLTLRRGVCQDFAHLQIAALRSLGLAARYVSGYLVTRPPPGKPKLVGSDASHAWVAVYFPGHGWVDFDPTNNCQVGQEHITLGWGRDYSDIAPIKGLYLGGGNSTLHVAVDVEERHVRLDGGTS
jgi:transglutaminase-like putative cysteine protease